ncbi:MAG: AAA family ATPase [Desulfobacterales bacterium]|nr:AAA family ATPase [Desulfobacterales bacterium]
MKIKIQNLGPINEFEIDLSKNFTILFGKNNIGKSYATIVVYLIIKNFLKEKNIHKNAFHLLDQIFPDIKDQIASIEETIEKFKTDRINIIEQIENIISHIIQMSLIENIQESFYATFEEFENLTNLFSNERMSITISTNLIKLSIEAKGNTFVISHFKILRETLDLIFVKTKGKNQETFSDNGEKLLYQLDNKENIRSVIYSLITQIMQTVYCDDMRNIASKVYYFPASRSGLYQSLNAYSQIFAELSRSRVFLKKKFEIPSIPEPVIDYFLELSNIKKRKSAGDCNLTEIAKEIEKSILQGEVIFNDRTKKISFKPYKMELYLDMFQTSSMVSEIAPFVSFLKYIANGKENRSKYLVFIEEPEAHLHPEIQVKLMEIFAKLINNNIKIILTTHSNYMFNKVNNLIIDRQVDISDMCSIIFKYSDKGGIADNIPINDLGIDDENFLDVTENLFNEKLELIDKMNRND